MLNDDLSCFDTSQVEIDYSDPIDLEWLECMNLLKEEYNKKIREERLILTAC